MAVNNGKSGRSYPEVLWGAKKFSPSPEVTVILLELSLLLIHHPHHGHYSIICLLELFWGLNEIINVYKVFSTVLGTSEELNNYYIFVLITLPTHSASPEKKPRITLGAVSPVIIICRLHLQPCSELEKVQRGNLQFSWRQGLLHKGTLNRLPLFSGKRWRGCHQKV